MNNDHRVRVGVVGGGIWGNFHLLACRDLEAQGVVELRAVAAKTEATASKQSKAFGIEGYTDYREMIEKQDLDAVTIATPDHLHREMCIFALEKGKHVLVEKPMDLSVSGCQAMVETAEKNNLLLQVDFHKRYDANNIDARAKVLAGKIGEPHYAYAYMEDKIIVPLEWLSAWASHSSPFWFIGVHKYDLVRWVTGREAISVSAHGRKGKLQKLGVDTFDSISASILMEGGLTCTVDVNWILPKQFDSVVNQGFRLVGSEGIIEIDAQERGLHYCFESEGSQTPNLNALFAEETQFGSKAVKGYFVDPIKHFLFNARFLKSGGTLEKLSGHYPSGEDGLRVTQVAEAVEQSITEGKTVKLSIPRRG